MARTRSPNYPFIPLETAVDRARVLWEKEGRHAAAPETIVDHWGYAPKSSGGRQVLAALRHFGLLEGRADQQRLTPLAQSILLGEPGTDGWLRDIRDAALRPAIHSEIWTKFSGDLPSEQNLRRYLIMERNFGESGATELIHEFQDTLAYARMPDAEADNLSDDLGDNAEDIEEMETTLTDIDKDGKKLDSRGRRQVQLPYSSTGWAVLQASFPLNDQEWDQMLAVLTAMRPALVEQDD